MVLYIGNSIFLIVVLVIDTSHAQSISFLDKMANISTSDDCVDNGNSEKIFGYRSNYFTDVSRNVFCLRERDGVERMSSTSRLFEDPRFMCANGPMTWYRGRRNVDFKLRPCLFWSSTPNFTYPDITNQSSSSYSMKRIMPDEFENFCRNPDEDPLGPWCHVAGGIRAPCFQPCLRLSASSSRFTCLNKEGFPYSGTLDDVVDLPQLVQKFESVHLMYESRYVLAASETKRLSTKSCIGDDGNITKSFGPWIAVFDEEAKNFIRVVGRKKLRELCSPPKPPSDDGLIEIASSKSNAFDKAMIEDELTVANCSFWKRCFSSCQDDYTPCWNPTLTFDYFGSNTTTFDDKQCISWTEASADILRMVKSNETLTARFQLYNWILFEDPEQYFVKSRLFLNTESSCMHLKHPNLSVITYRSNPFFTDKELHFEISKMYHQGPGCFVKHNKTMTFEPCYSQCDLPPSSTIPLKPLCEKGNGYSLCKQPRPADWLTRGRVPTIKGAGLKLNLLMWFFSCIFHWVLSENQ